MVVAAEVFVADFCLWLLVQFREIARPHQPRHTNGKAHRGDDDEKETGLGTNSQIVSYVGCF
jgi:hypothetical protein